SVQHYQAAQFAFELRYFAGADPDSGRSVFAGLAQGSADSASRIDIVGRGGHDFLFCDGAALGMFAPAEIAPALKAHVTDALCRSVEDGFLSHAGLVSANGRTVLLVGAPGAGKTTLTLALAGSGFSYGGDDI